MTILVVLGLLISATPALAGQSWFFSLGRIAVQSVTSQTRDRATTLKTLQERLRAQGITVSWATPRTIKQPFFSVAGRVLVVNKEQVQVFEFATAKKAEEEARPVDPDGSAIGTTHVSWVGTPHFFRSGKLIVLYIGENDVVLKSLETALGAQFAGQR